MNEPKNVLIGKIGKSLKMTGQKISTGDDTCIMLYSVMSKLNPNYNFYCCSRNAINEKLPVYDKLFPNHNVHSVFNEDMKTMAESIKKIGIDFALVFNGMVSTSTNFRDVLRVADLSRYKKPLMCFENYAAPVIYAVNELMCPLYVISEDARFITINAPELFNRERRVFTQFDQTLESAKHVLSWEDCETLEHFEKHRIKCDYMHTEKIFMMGIAENWKERINIDKKLNSDHKLVMFTHGHGCAKINSGGTNPNGRFPAFKEWILDGLKGTNWEGAPIYGKWQEEVTNEYPQIQAKTMLELGDDYVDAVKYTFVKSIVDGFVTIKPYEMICRGIIPFMDANYDKYHLLTDLPQALFVKTPQELVERLDYYEANEAAYRDLLERCIKAIRQDYLDGSFLNNRMLSQIASDLGYSYEPSKGLTNNTFDHFSKSVILL